MTLREQSIARRLILSVLLIQAISAIGLIGATLVHERHARFQAFDVMLRGHADSILGSVEDADDEGDNVMLDRTNLRVPENDVYEVRDAAGRLLGRSANWSGDLEERARGRDSEIFQGNISGAQYRLIHLNGVRVVDPGKADGGTSHGIGVVYGSKTKPVWREIDEAVAFSAVASCLLLLVTGALVAWLLHRGLSPLRELAAEAEGVSAERWSFVAPPTARFTKELAPLAMALEAAVGRLERTFDLERRFISDAAHELKTAVAVIKSSLQLLTMRQRSAEEYEIGVHRSLDDCERMEATVAEMLTLARLESRADADTRPRCSDLARSARIAAERLQPLAELRRVRVTLGAGVLAAAGSSESLGVGLSEEECTLLCSNLLMNALVHSGRSGEVELTGELGEAGWIEFRLRDRGEGIDEAILPHVFERFYRGDPSRTRVTGGSGLGLAICKAMVESAGGSIRIESTRGVGTVAIVRLPRAPGMPGMLVAAMDAQVLRLQV